MGRRRKKNGCSNFVDTRFLNDVSSLQHVQSCLRQSFRSEACADAIHVVNLCADAIHLSSPSLVGLGRFALPFKHTYSSTSQCLFFVASAFRPVWPGRCDLSFICIPQSTRALDQGGVDCGIQIKLKCSDRAILAERRSQQKKHLRESGCRVSKTGGFLRFWLPESVLTIRFALYGLVRTCPEVKRGSFRGV